MHLTLLPCLQFPPKYTARQESGGHEAKLCLLSVRRKEFVLERKEWQQAGTNFGMHEENLGRALFSDSGQDIILRLWAGHYGEI